MASPRPPHTFNNPAYPLPNGATTGGPTPGATPLLPNNGRVIQTGGVRVLCVADVRGNLKSLNELAKQARADHIIHTGDFGFYDDTSLDRIADKTLKHVAQYSPLLPESVKRNIAQVPAQQSIKSRFPSEQLALSELPQLLNKQLTLDVPVYTVWGACEDVRVLEKFRSGEYKVDKLHIIDEASSRLLDIGGVKLRLLGLGGAVVMHKLFDNGEGKTTIAGGQGTMWTTLLQMGELVDTANRVYDPTETRVLITHASPAREGMLNQLSVNLKADFSISAGLHFRYGSSYNEFSVNPSLDHYRGKLAASKASFNDVWDTVKGEVETAITTNDAQKTLLENALDIVNKMPTVANGGNPFGGPVAGGNAGGQVDESAFKNLWNFNLADAAFGYLVLEVDNGRIGTEMRAQGFNFSHRGGKSVGQTATAGGAQQTQTAPPLTGGASGGTNVAATPVPPGPGHGRGVGPQFGQVQQQQQPAYPAGPPGYQGQDSGPAKQPSPPTKSAASPAPAGPTKDKPATPQPTNGSVEKVAAPEANGTVDKSSESASKASAGGEKKQTNGLFIANVDTEDAAKNLFTAEDKVVKVDKLGKWNFVAFFGSPEEAKAALDRQPADHKKSSPPGPNRKPHVKIFEDRGGRNPPREGNAGPWQGSNRGGASAPQRSGYQSGSATSDGEGGRGRGGYGGRGARRGGDRGGRGSGRGGGRGGGFTKGASGGESPAPASTPASASGAGDSKPTNTAES